MDALKEPNSETANLDFSRLNDDSLLVRLGGTWKIGRELPSADEVKKQLEMAPLARRVVLDGRHVKEWDTVLLAFLTKVTDYCSRERIRVEKKLLPQGVQRLLALASAVPEKKDTGKDGERESFLVRVGESGVSFVQSANEMLAFIGEAFVVFCKLMVGKARFRRSDFFLILQECGADALPIVSLISLLVGLILAFVGAVQLMMFGAQIYVANLVAIAMVRVMGAMMTGIIMAGRTGAAFAAQLGTMQVNEELDALTTLRISPMEFLVLPRMLALCLMMPLLCLYADLMGILGGLIVGVGMLDLNVVEYFHQTRASVDINTFLIGLFHSAVFGVLVALAGCLRGIQCGRSASAVGQAATSAVVTGIVSIIVATAIITVVCNVLGI
jgi:phospholipid/cholesterol/gamma-HCH transport system permease protein